MAGKEIHVKGYNRRGKAVKPSVRIGGGWPKGKSRLRKVVIDGVAYYTFIKLKKKKRGVKSN